MINNFRHFGITVYNIEKALQFYCDGLGFQKDLVFERPGDYTEQVTGVSGTVLKGAIISLKGFVIEILEYRDVEERPESSGPVQNPGAAHICLEVESIQQTMKRLAPFGAMFQPETVTVPTPRGRNRVMYGWDPQGIAFELVEAKKEV